MTVEIEQPAGVVPLRPDGTDTATVNDTPIESEASPTAGTSPETDTTPNAEASTDSAANPPSDANIDPVASPDHNSGTNTTADANSHTDVTIESDTDADLIDPRLLIEPDEPPAKHMRSAPVCAVFLRSNGAGEVLIDDEATPISCPDLVSARRRAVEILIDAARAHNQSLLVVCSDPAGLFSLRVSPDGMVTQAEPSAPAPEAVPQPNFATTVTVSAPQPPSGPPPEAPPRIQTFINQPMNPSPADAAEPPPPRYAFITDAGTPLPAEQGWRGRLAKRGIPLPPSEAELAERAQRTAVAQHWSSPRTISVVNGKGGAGKTPTTICLASVFARFGGSGVLAWDNNQTRGTLGWRTEQGPHEATLLDLLPEVPKLLTAEGTAAGMSRFVHHQSRDFYDVLRSKSTLLADEQRITPEDVDAIWTVAAKYYRLILMDSGNDESDPMWRRMIDHTDQLVTVTTTRADHAEAGALLLEALARRSEHSFMLAKNSVTVITQADPKASEESIRRIRKGYEQLSREVVFIPYDPAMVEGALAYDLLKPATQRAWLSAAAAVAGGLS